MLFRRSRCAYSCVDDFKIEQVTGLENIFVQKGIVQIIQNF